MRRAVALLLCLVVVGVTVETAPEANAQAGTVVVYSALDSTVTTQVLKAFEAASGLKTQALTLAAAGTLATRIIAEKARPQADIFLGGSIDFHAPLAKQGLLLPYLSPRLSEANLAKQYYDPAGLWYVWYIGALAIMYNRTRFAADVAPKGVQPPAAWDDLTNPAYRGQLVLPSPITTGGGYIWVAAQIFRFNKDEERAFAFLKQIAANATFTPAAPAGIALVSRGEMIAGMNWGHDITSMAVNQGFPVSVVFPPDTATELGGVSIIKGGPNLAGAKRFIDFMLGRTAQDINAKYGLRFPVRADVPSPAGMPQLSSMKFVRYDRPWAIDNQRRIQDRWQREIGK